MSFSNSILRREIVKALKIIGIVILILVVIFVVLGLVAPKEYKVERTVLINAPKEVVFAHVQYWKNWMAWSPWAEMDSAMTSTYEGTDGETGAVYKWVGDPKKTGKGEMINTGVKSNEEIAYHLKFIEPWASESEGYMRVSDAEGGTQAAWGMYGKNPFPWNVFGLFMNMEKMIAPDFDKGLNNLKGICEKEAAIIAKYPVQTVEFKAVKYAAIQKTLTMPEMSAFMGESYGKIGEACKKAKAKCTGAPVGIYFTWDDKTMTSDMAAGMPVNKKVETDEIKMIEIPSGTAYLVDYFGAYDQSMDAHTAINMYFMKNNLKPKMPVVEEYITDPTSEPDTTKWQTKIYYFAE